MEQSQMTTAVITFTYNEKINLPIWLRYYGSNFGEENLFIVDRGSNDGSVDDVGRANLLKIPRNEFDEHQKADFLINLHKALLNYYKTVIITDCDELLSPDPLSYPTLRQYIDESDFEFVNAIGLEVLHIVDQEGPLDLTRPILSQRQFARFQSPSCKNLIARTPIRWLTGFHSMDRPPRFDGILYMFHTRVMDFYIALARQQINRDTVWSSRSLEQKLGAHHRFDQQTFVHNNFLGLADMIKRGEIGEFEFEKELEAISVGTKEHQGSFYIPMNIQKLVRIPERFAEII
jgi:hypothetical protein